MALAIAFTEVFLAFAVLVLVSLYIRNKKDPRYPPGPRALPFVGNLLQLGSRPQQVLTKWAKEYGPIYSIKMGTDDTIVVNDHKLLKELFAENTASGRSQNPIFIAFSGGNYGVVNTEGAHWEVQRRFTLRKLRDFGFAKSSMEGLILDEANSMIHHLEKHMDAPIQGRRLFNGVVVNALWNIVSRERNEWDAKPQPPIMEKMEELVQALNYANTSGLVFAPSLRHVAPSFFGWTRWVNSVHNVMQITNKAVKKHADKLDPDCPEDLIDHYLIEMKNAKDPDSSFYKEAGEKNLKALIVDLFAAGSETTSHTCSWIVLYLSYHQQVQSRMQDELDSVVGTNRLPSLSDRPNLPYTEAVIMEVLRISNILPNGVMHRMLEDVVFHGFFFPKGVTVISNLYKILRDPEIWGDADNFRPERFLSQDGKKVIKHEAFVAFSVGKRQCLGESLAKDTLFLIMACIFQKFKVLADPEHPIPDFEPPPGFLHETKPFKFLVRPRDL